VSSPLAGRLDVEADLTLDVDGVTARLHGRGGRLVLSGDHPERVWAAAVSALLPAGLVLVDGPRGIAGVARALAGIGIRLDVEGPHGVVASLGAGVGSRVGQALTGSDAVRPGAPLAVLALAWQARRRAVVTGLVGIGAVALFGVAVGRRRRR
jgi:hypothetical protein